MYLTSSTSSVSISIKQAIKWSVGGGRGGGGGPSIEADKGQRAECGVRGGAGEPGWGSLLASAQTAELDRKTILGDEEFRASKKHIN